MNKAVIGIIVVVVAALAVVGVVALNNDDEPEQTPTSSTTQQNTETETEEQNQEEQQPTQASETASVSIESFAFTPAQLTVKKGTKVTWTNRDSVQHNIVPDEGDSEAFSGGPLLSKDTSYSFTFNTPGTYAYHCGPHPQMTATVTVTE